MSDAPVARALGLRKDYRGAVALRGLDLELRAGEVVGFLGPNGAGKTTTVKLLLGLVRPTAGTVELFGQPLAGNEKRLLRRVGAIVEAPAFYPYLSARDNLRALARLGGVDERGMERVLELVGLRGAERHPFAHYSVGMKQRLGLASVLLRDPQLIVLDEPTSGLDPAGQRDIDAVIRSLADKGRTVFLCSHSLAEVEQICDRVAIMRGGEKRFEGAVSELLAGRDELLMRVEPAEAALAVLLALEFVADVSNEGEYLVVAAASARTRDIVAALAARELYPTELRPRARSMEGAYDDVMREAA